MEDDGDDDDSGADGEDDSGEAPDAETLGRGVVRQLVLDSRPRVPFLREGRVMVVGYPRQEVERGMPAAGAQPTFFWRSEELRLTWPLRIEAPLPSGRTLFLVLDLDDDGMPSPGDLCSVPAYDFEPPAEGREAPFVFERAFGLTEPDEDEPVERDSGR